MTFSKTTNARISKRWDGSSFVEEDLTLTGTNGISVTVDAGGFTIEGSSSAIAVKEDDVEVSAAVSTLDFAHALDVVDQGSGELQVSVDESELTTVVFLSGNQTISGIKTFAQDMNVGGNLDVTGNVDIDGNLTVNGTTTTINTEELLVEDNGIILNYTVTGSPTEDAFLEVERGTENNAQLFWNETSDQWEAGVSGSLEKIILQSDLTAQNLEVKDDDVSVETNVLVLDYGHALDVTDQGSGEVLVAVDESEFTTVLFLAGGTMTGNISLDTADILNTSSGVNDLGAAANPFAELHVDQGFNYDAPTLDAHIANKEYVDSQVGSFTFDVKEDDVVAASAIQILDFGHALDVTDQSGEALIAVDESEFTSVVFLAGAQTITGKKTFSAGLAVASGVEPASSGDTQSAVLGEIRWGDDYLYVNVDGTNWKRTALASF